MDELLYQAEALMTLNPGLSDRELAHRLGAWLVSAPRCAALQPEAETDGEVLVEFFRVMRRTPYFHATSYVLH